MEKRIKTFLIILISACGLISQSVLGQDTRTLRKIDEYSKCQQGVPGCINMEDEWARIDSLGAELRANPESQAYIIGYKSLRTLPGSSLRHINYVRDLVRSRVVDDSRVKVIDGGYRENLTIELWIAPNCSSVPSPSQTIAVKAPDAQSSYKFSEFRPPLRKEIVEHPFFEDELVYYSSPVLMDGFASMLEKEPSLRGYIIAYDGQNDRVGTAFKFTETYRAYIYESATIGNPVNTVTSTPSRVISLNGGRRKERTIELWLVSSNAPEPKMTPTVQTKRNRKR
ncbi:MAG: hypothetical protein WKF74_00780 [Pyrinomonadaceae bacterium]